MIAPPAADGDFVSTVDGRTENLVNLPGPVGVATLTSLAGGISQNVYSFTLEKQRSQSFVCMGNDTVETSRFGTNRACAIKGLLPQRIAARSA